MFGVFFIGKEAGIMGGENLWTSPKTKESPAEQLTQRARAQYFFKDLRWSLVFTKSLRLSPDCEAPIDLLRKISCLFKGAGG